MNQNNFFLIILGAVVVKLCYDYSYQSDLKDCV